MDHARASPGESRPQDRRTREEALTGPWEHEERRKEFQRASSSTSTRKSAGTIRKWRRSWGPNAVAGAADFWGKQHRRKSEEAKKVEAVAKGSPRGRVRRSAGPLRSTRADDRGQPAGLCHPPDQMAEVARREGRRRPRKPASTNSAAPGAGAIDDRGNLLGAATQPPQRRVQARIVAPSPRIPPATLPAAIQGDPLPHDGGPSAETRRRHGGDLGGPLRRSGRTPSTPSTSRLKRPSRSVPWRT